MGILFMDWGEIKNAPDLVSVSHTIGPVVYGELVPYIVVCECGAIQSGWMSTERNPHIGGRHIEAEYPRRPSFVINDNIWRHVECPRKRRNGNA